MEALFNLTIMKSLSKLQSNRSRFLILSITTVLQGSVLERVILCNEGQIKTEWVGSTQCIWWTRADLSVD